MIDWLFKHPLIIFLIIMGVSSLIKHLKSSGEAPPPEAGPRPFGGGDDDGERTRRLQEEIRRKIAERRGQAAPPPLPHEEPEPLFPTPRWTETVEEPSPYKLPEPPPLVAALPAVDSVLVRQRELAEQLAALKVAAQQVEANRVSWAISKPAETEAQATAARAGDVYGLRELRTARSLRKAMVMREVLGPPVALR
ncbi:MAG: hypothetical protein WC661_18170 [Opitutaceae bacterium]|jgi:hypothetical protein